MVTDSGSLFLALAAILAAAKLGGEVCERVLKTPAVIGEILLGMVLGKSILGVVDPTLPPLEAIASIGAVLLLFEVGLESDLGEMARVGVTALLVTLVGVVVPFALGWGTGVLLGLPSLATVFIGATLTATSIGITARVFGDLKVLSSRAAQVVLGAAVMDDVIGLIILATVTAMATTGSVSPADIVRLSALALAFLVGSLALGTLLAPRILTLMRQMHSRAAVSVAAVALAFLFAGLAGLFGLAPIIGAFAAGLVLARAETKAHIEPKVKSLADVFVPTFFVLVGAQIDVTQFNPTTPGGQHNLLIGGVLSVVAIVGKVVSGLAYDGSWRERAIVGVGMIPRGEVGLIFASIGLSLKVFDASLYAAVLMVVVVTTLITPPILARIVTPRTMEPVPSPVPSAG